VLSLFCVAIITVFGMAVLTAIFLRFIKKYNTLFFLTIVSGLVLISQKVFYVEHKRISIFSLNELIIILIFLFSMISLITLIIYQLIRLIIKKKAIEFDLFIILGIQILIIVTLIFLPDFFQLRSNLYSEAAAFIENMDIKEDESTEEINKRIPQKYRNLARFSQIYVKKKQDVILIEFYLTGSGLGCHQYLLYKSDGNDPKIEELWLEKATYRKLKERWYWIDCND